MTHKLVSLTQFKHHSEQLTSEGVLCLVNFLLQNSENGKEVVISGIFRQLYHLGEATSGEFLCLLNKRAKELVNNRRSINDAIGDKKNDDDDHVENINDLPEVLLTHIASYLEAKEIFCKWGHVNRKFLQIGYKPETFQDCKWEFPWNTGNKIESHPPKFKLDCCMTRLKRICTNNDFSDLFDVGKLTHLRDVTISNTFYGEETTIERLTTKKEEEEEEGADDAQYQSQTRSITLDGIHWDKEHYAGQLYKTFFQLNRRYTNLNCIKLNDVRIGSDTLMEMLEGRIKNEQEVKNDIELLLNSIFPLSPKEMELKNRKKSELTNELMLTMPSRRVEEAELKIEREVELKYNQIDANELTFDEIEEKKIAQEGKQSNKCKWRSNVEMLAIKSTDYCNAGRQLTGERRELIDGNLTTGRINSSLGNLRSFMYHGPLRHGRDRICFWGYIGDKILNNICNKLVSLHINPLTMRNWQFMREFQKMDYPYPCTFVGGFINNNNNCNYKKSKDFESKPWFPANVEELCLYMSRYESDMDNPDVNIEDEYLYFWFKNVHSNTFPQLKHLKIHDKLHTKTVSSLNHFYNDYNKSDDSSTSNNGNNNNNNTNNSSNTDINNRDKLLATELVGTTLENLFSLIENGLESLHLVLDGFAIKDIFPQAPDDCNPLRADDRDIMSPTRIIQFVKKLSYLLSFARDCNILKQTMHKNGRKSDFILKLELNVDGIDANDSDDMAYEHFSTLWRQHIHENIVPLCFEMHYIYDNFKEYFDNVMVGFKIKFELNGYTEHKDYLKHIGEVILNRTMKDDRVKDYFCGDDSKVVDCAVKTKIDCDNNYYYDYEETEGPDEHFMFGMMIKNRDINRTKNDNKVELESEADEDEPRGESIINEEKSMCEKCHMEPYFQHQCEYCKAQPWLEV